MKYETIKNFKVVELTNEIEENIIQQGNRGVYYRNIIDVLESLDNTKALEFKVDEFGDTKVAYLRKLVREKNKNYRVQSAKLNGTRFLWLNKI